MNERSVAVGSGPETQALIGEWTAAGFVVESSFDGGKWWHRRISPDYIRDVNLPMNPMNMFATIESGGVGAAERIGQSLAAGHMVESRRFGAGWFNRVGRKAVAQ